MAPHRLLMRVSEASSRVWKPQLETCCLYPAHFKDEETEVPMLSNPAKDQQGTAQLKDKPRLWKPRPGLWGLSPMGAGLHTVPCTEMPHRPCVALWGENTHSFIKHLDHDYDEPGAVPTTEMPTWIRYCPHLQGLPKWLGRRMCERLPVMRDTWYVIHAIMVPVQSIVGAQKWLILPKGGRRRGLGA